MIECIFIAFSKVGVKLLDGRKDSFNEKDTLFDDQTDRFIQVAE